MADLRTRTAVFIVDPVTNANAARVNASDNFQVVVNEALPTGANTIGAVTLVEHAILDDDPVGVNGPVLMTALVFDDTTPVVVEEGDAGYQRMSLNRNAYTTLRDAAGAERGANVTAAFELNVLATPQAGVDIGDVTINGFAAAETEADDDVISDSQTSLRTINLLYGYDGTNWERVQTDASGSMDVNVTLALPIGTNEIGDIGSINTNIVPGVAATSLGKAESATHTTADTGVAVWGVRNDAETLLAADGQYIPFMMSSAGRVLVETQGGAGGTSETDSDPFTVATDLYVPVGGIFDDVAPGDLTEGDGGAVRMSAVREMYTNIRDGAGGERSANVTAAFELNVIASAQAGVDIGDVTINGAPTGASAIEVQGTVAEGVAVANNPFLIAGDDGTNVRHVLVDTEGHLQVDILTGAGSDAPAGEARAHNSSTDTAAAATFDVDTADFGIDIKKLAGVEFGASVPIKCTVMSVDNDVETILTVLWSKAGETLVWKPPHRDYYEVSFVSATAFEGFRLELTNLDNSESADLYGTLYTED